MSRSKLRGVLLFVLMSGSAQGVLAENSHLILAFGGDPGSPLPHAYNDGVPDVEGSTYGLRIAVIDPDIKHIFYDTALTIAVAEQIVQSVTAERAYPTLIDCNKARTVILEKLTNGLPREHAPGGGEWQRHSADGKVVGRVVCAQRRHYPMPVLRLAIELNQ
jgi:hypothetical protein